jgi:CRP-like cAMP-binding protein
MTPNELKALTVLRSTDLFGKFDTVHLKKLASIATETTFDWDEVIYEAGEVGKAIYLIQEGMVVIEMDVADYGSVTLYRVGPGEIFGWSSLFPKRRKKARARALESTRALVLNATRLRDLFRADHGLEDACMNCLTNVIADRLYTTRQQLSEALMHR